MKPSPQQPPNFAFGELTSELLQELRRRLGEESVITGESALDRYGRDFTEDFYFPPRAAVLPRATEQVAQLLRFASEHRLPVTPRGAGTGLSGGALPVHGGIALGLERMNRIRGIDTRNLVAEAEAGVVTAELQRRVEEVGLFYPPDPGSRETCLLGGNIAEDSAGPRSCKYGTTRRFVLGLEAVLPSGEVIRTGGANRKDVTGYNLTQLLVGSEGTLAVITAATLRLLASPRHRLTLALPFPRLEQGAAAVEAIFREGFEPATCELVEERALAAVERVETIPKELSGQGAVLLLELDGDDGDRLLEIAAELHETVRPLGAGEALVAQDAAEQRRLWKVRSQMGEAVKALSIYKEADTVVPRSRLVELVEAAREVAERRGLDAVCFGHAGDGNLHVLLLRGDLEERAWQERRDAAEEELFQRVLELGGAVTGEHGIGWTQRRFLEKALGPAALGVTRAIKQAFDPLGILNPGKILPEEIA